VTVPTVAEADAADLLGLTAALVAVPSESFDEAALADLVDARLQDRAPGLTVTRIGPNVVARTGLGRDRRVVLGGHLDTVPANGNARPVVDGDVLSGVGSADMKGGLAVLLRLAEEITAVPDRLRHDVTLVFYECEEVAERHNGLRRVIAERPELLDADFAVLLEPTDGWVEAGCQGVLMARADFHGARAHAARPWTGANAIHRAAPVLERLARHEMAGVDVDGLHYREAFQVVRVAAGVTDNVVPDECSLVVNRRFAPCYTAEEVERQVRELLDGADAVEILQVAPAAAPNLTDPLVAEFVGALDLPVRPKLGWTDVARFAARGVPALNFGPGDPLLAHTAGESVTRRSLEHAYHTLATFVGLA
jgi:succinyl-diaminopimelate desuccinylase